MAYKKSKPVATALQEELRLKLAGLYTNPNMFSSVPEGALLIADNIVIDRDMIASTRRGFGPYGDPVSLTGNVKSLFTYNGQIIAWTDNDELYYDGNVEGTAWVQYSGNYAVPDSGLTGARLRSVEANKNFYFTTSLGIYKLDQIATTPLLAGAPPGLGGSGVTSGASGFMTNSTNVAYRIVWGYKDINDNLILGAPSDRIIVGNTSGGTRDVDLTFLIPPGTIDETWFYQVYRSGESATINDAPDDELQQVYEDNPTSGEITAGTITITDSTPTDLRQATLYTSPSREGIENANYRPPFAKDVTEYKNMVFYANCRSLHRFTLTLNSAGTSPGIVIGDTITFTNTADASTFTLTGAAAEDALVGEFQVFSGGTPSENIASTAGSIVNICNTYLSNDFLTAYYKSGFDDLPGEMLFEKRTLDYNSFNVVSSNSYCWNQIIPSSGTTSYNVSVNDENTNRVYYSKIQQPEAVPLYRYFDIGSALKPIQRILALRDGIIVLKDDGVFRIEGSTDQNLSVSVIDRTVTIQAPNSAVLNNNRVFFFSEQGIFAVSEIGSELLSRPIETQLLNLNADNNANFHEYTFAVSYESDRKFILSTITSPGDEICTQQFVYNTVTQTWTRWDRTNYCGIVSDRGNRLYWGGTFLDAAHLYEERKSLTSADYADEQYDVTIVSSSDLDVVLADVTNVEVGDTIVQSASIAVIDAIDTGTEHIPECSLYFETTEFEALTAYFTSDFLGEAYGVDVNVNSLGGWGQFNWGQIPWGGDVIGSRRIRVLVPRECQRTNWTTIRLDNSRAFSSFSLQGISIMFNVQSERQRN